MWIKICGTTNLEDAQLAADLGADAIGFVFAPSLRRVTPEQVAAITPHLPKSIERVGVFHDHDPIRIAAIAQQAGLTVVQLHGTPSQDQQAPLEAAQEAQAGQPISSSPSQLAAPASQPPHRDPPQTPFALAHALARQLPPSVSIIQTLHWTVTPNPDPHAQATQAQQILDQIATLSTIPAVQRVLIDSKVGVALGGTGVPFNWTAARDVFASTPAGLRLILAGGLSPGNVAQAVQLLHPWGLDAVSGIEATPGRKDAKKLAAFFQNARA